MVASCDLSRQGENTGVLECPIVKQNLYICGLPVCLITGKTNFVE